MKKIVRGNDFVMRIPVRKVVGGEQKPFPLPACTDVAVSLVGAYRRVRLEHEVDVADDSLLLARVEGDKIALGSYALEVKGKLFGNDWRSNEYEQVTIVDRNSEADTELGDTDEGEPSVEMDTAVVVLPPSAELEKLIEDANEAIGKVDTAVTRANDAAAGAEKVDASLGEDNVLAVTDRTGAKKTLSLATPADAAGAVKGVERAVLSLGPYSARPDIVLTAKETDKAISADGVKVSKRGWAIAEFTAELGNEYLFKPGVTDGSVCVFAEYIDKIETRAIDYALTYDASGRVATATATYNGKTYTYTYTYGDTETTVTDQSGNTVNSLPSVYTTTIGSYNVLTRLNEGAELPEDGYCRFVSNFQSASAIKVAVSYKVGSADLTMKVVRDGMTASMCTQLSKINKKVDENSQKLAGKNRLFIHTCKEGTQIKLDNKAITLEARKGYTFENFTTFAITRGKNAINRIDANFDLNNMTNQNSLFAGCSSLTTLDVSGWDTSKVTSMGSIFQDCSSLITLDVSGWDTSKVTNITHAFDNCSSLTTLDVSGWDTGAMASFNSLFARCPSLTILDMSGWDTSKVINMGYMFQSAGSLAVLKFGEGFGKMLDSVGTLDLSMLRAWKNDTVKTLLTLYDRKTNGMGVITIKLHANAKAVLGEDGIAQLTAKGYTIA